MLLYEIISGVASSSFAYYLGYKMIKDFEDWKDTFFSRAWISLHNRRLAKYRDIFYKEIRNEQDFQEVLQRNRAPKELAKTLSSIVNN